ncbi:Non-heme dioxygenase N-terminal domain [Sesbania bispinosa]|nr:Non-heme dioxygenase N-terminal domain [Sesbania bispinosa]
MCVLNPKYFESTLALKWIMNLHLETYKTLSQGSLSIDDHDIRNKSSMMEGCEIPLIDLSRLNHDPLEREECMNEITEAAREWGLFQVVNHGVSQELLQSLMFEEIEVFHRPFASTKQWRLHECETRVVTAEKVERFSVAYFYIPSADAVIESYVTPPVYRKFTFREYREQTEKDVKETGDKVGLSRFLL